MTRQALHLLLLASLAGAAGGCDPPKAASARASAAAPAAAGGGQLARVRPPAPPCTAGPGMRPHGLLSRAQVAFEAGEMDRALACADQALEQAPRLVAALHYRAAALAALDRTDEARLAYARALAIDPDDVEVLRDAAELYVTRLRGERGATSLGLEYALRGARLAPRAARDRPLTAELLALAASAENDLGESTDALAHADEALRLDPRDLDALYERGVALYELCRFREARAALEQVLARDPQDAWAAHHLALVLERTGDGARSRALERRARALAPDEFPPTVDVDASAFEDAVHRAVEALPASERRALADVPVEVRELPAIDDLTASDPPLSPSILGLFRGPAETERCPPEDGSRCRSIVFYRRNLARFARSRAELEEQVRVTLLHELGHLHGESDDDLRARGLE